MSPELTSLIEKSKAHKMTPQERWDQRVSFIFGMLPFRSKMTREDVIKYVTEHHGARPA